MKKTVSREERIEFKNNTNLVILSDNIELKNDDCSDYYYLNFININNIGELSYDEIYLLNNIPIGVFDIDIKYDIKNKKIYVHSDDDCYEVELKNNEYFMIYEDEKNNYLHIDIKKHHLDIVSRKLNDVQYPIIKTEIKEDYDGNTTGKLYLKLDEEQLDDFCIFALKSKDFDYVIKEIQYLKNRFDFYSPYLKKMFEYNENSTIIMNNNIYKIISINQLYIELLPLGVKNKKIVKCTYLDIINNASNISFITEDVLISYEDKFYKNNIEVEEDLYNKLSPIYKDSDLEKMRCFYELVKDSSSLDREMNIIIKEMINNYYKIKDEFFNELNDWEKESLNLGIYFVLRNESVMFSDEGFEMIEQEFKREMIKREEH